MYTGGVLIELGIVLGKEGGGLNLAGSYISVPFTPMLKIWQPET